MNPEQRSRQLLDIAEKLFTERGYEGVSIEGIATAAGVTRPTVYQHHGNKDGIFLACVRRARAEFEDALFEAMADSDGSLRSAITIGAQVFYDMLAANPERWALLFATSASLGSDLAEQLLDLRFRTVAQIMIVARPHAEGVSEEDLEAFAHAVSGIGEQLGRWWLRNPQIPQARVLEHYSTLVESAAAATLTTPVAGGD